MPAQQINVVEDSDEGTFYRGDEETWEYPLQNENGNPLQVDDIVFEAYESNDRHSLVFSKSLGSGVTTSQETDATVAEVEIDESDTDPAATGNTTNWWIELWVQRSSDSNYQTMYEGKFPIEPSLKSEGG